MMRRLTEKMNLAKTVLKELNKQKLSRTELEMRTVRKSGTPATFDAIVRFLIQSGYIVKTEQKHRAPYAITEKGAKFLEVL